MDKVRIVFYSLNVLHRPKGGRVNVPLTYVASVKMCHIVKIIFFVFNKNIYDTK